jgi:hypothetical protein
MYLTYKRVFNAYVWRDSRAACCKRLRDAAMVFSTSRRGCGLRPCHATTPAVSVSIVKVNDNTEFATRDGLFGENFARNLLVPSQNFITMPRDRGQTGPPGARRQEQDHARQRAAHVCTSTSPGTGLCRWRGAQAEAAQKAVPRRVLPAAAAATPVRRRRTPRRRRERPWPRLWRRRRRHRPRHAGCCHDRTGGTSDGGGRGAAVDQQQAAAAIEAAAAAPAQVAPEAEDGEAGAVVAVAAGAVVVEEADVVEGVAALGVEDFTPMGDDELTRSPTRPPCLAAWAASIGAVPAGGLLLVDLQS